MFILSSIIPDENSSNVKEPVAKGFFSSISTSNDRSIFNFYIIRIVWKIWQSNHLHRHLLGTTLQGTTKPMSFFCLHWMQCILKWLFFRSWIPYYFKSLLFISISWDDGFRWVGEFLNWLRNLRSEKVSVEIHCEVQKPIKASDEPILKCFHELWNNLRTSKLHFQIHPGNLFGPFPET